MPCLTFTSYVSNTANTHDLQVIKWLQPSKPTVIWKHCKLKIHTLYLTYQTSWFNNKGHCQKFSCLCSWSCGLLGAAVYFCPAMRKKIRTLITRKKKQSKFKIRNIVSTDCKWLLQHYKLKNPKSKHWSWAPSVSEKSIVW